MGVRGTTIFKYVALGVAVLVVAGIAAAAWRTGALPIREWFKARSSSESGAAGDQVAGAQQGIERACVGPPAIQY